MKKNFDDIRAIARENIQNNPNIRGVHTDEVAVRYLNFLRDEVREVEHEIRPNNTIHLVDELSDIAWVYAVLLEHLESRGYIDSVDDVWEHAEMKFKERLPGCFEDSPELWEQIKNKQKEDIRVRHHDTYGNEIH